MLKKKKQALVGLDIKKNILRFSILEKEKYTYGERLLNGTVIKGDNLRNEKEFADELHELLSEYHLKDKQICFTAINSKLLIRKIPMENLRTEHEIREYLYMELGDSIKLPFEQPIFDLLILEQQKNKKKQQQAAKTAKKKKKEKEKGSGGKRFVIKRNRFAVKGHIPFIATSEPIIESIGDGIVQSGNQPVAVDFSALAYVRLFKRKIKWNENFILVEVDSGVATITIFEELTPVYVQFEEYNVVGWKYIEKDGKITANYNVDKEKIELAKLGAIINSIKDYFSTSLSPESVLSQIYVVGEHPLLRKEVCEVFQEANDLPVKALTSSTKGPKNETIPDRFMLATALAMKEV